MLRVIHKTNMEKRYNMGKTDVVTPDTDKFGFLRFVDNFDKETFIDACKDCLGKEVNGISDLTDEEKTKVDAWLREVLEKEGIPMERYISTVEKIRDRKKGGLTILRYRFLAAVYPHISMETEVQDGDKKYYVNMDVNLKGEKEESFLEDGWWSYSCPLDEVDFNSDKDIVSDVDFTDVLAAMLERWNADPRFISGGLWRGPWMNW